MVIRYRRFGTPYRFHLQGSRNVRDPSDVNSRPSKTGPAACTETSVRNCHCAQRERSQKGGSPNPPSLSLFPQVNITIASVVQCEFWKYVYCAWFRDRTCCGKAASTLDRTVKLLKAHSLSVCALTCEILLWYANSNEELMGANHKYIYIVLFLRIFLWGTI